MTAKQRGKKRVREIIRAEVHRSVILGERVVFVNVNPTKFYPYDKVRVTVELLERKRRA
jgi:hypothetical protein